MNKGRRGKCGHIRLESRQGQDQEGSLLKKVAFYLTVNSEPVAV